MLLTHSLPDLYVCVFVVTPTAPHTFPHIMLLTHSLAVVELEAPNAVQDPVANSSGHAVARHDDL